MNNKIKKGVLLTVLVCIASLSTACKQEKIKSDKELAQNKVVKKKKPAKKHSAAFKAYWYAGEAEITSYTLEQPRYGQLRDGHAVLIYVTEPFLSGKQVKADQSSSDNIPVLKLNSTKKYLTGIYPYSIMSSTFYPVADNQHAIKVTNAVQEWCGHVYTQINNRSSFEVDAHSYFESEADQRFELEKTILENELWTKIRIDPENLPTGELEVIPALEFIRLGHIAIKGYAATASLALEGDNYNYELHYPELERKLKITFSKDFPYTIEGWTESFKSGFGNNAQILTTKAIKNKELKAPYWRLNGNKDLVLRDSLGI